MCPASKSLEADEMLKYKNSQEKLIINQAKMENYHCFALSRATCSSKEACEWSTELDL